MMTSLRSKWAVGKARGGRISNRYVTDEQRSCWPSTLSWTPAKRRKYHFARSWWYSWMVVRVYCAWFPELLRNPILAEHLGNPLFETSCLRRLLNIFPSPCSDLLAGLQRLASHSSGERPWKHYLRSAPILTRLLHDLEYASERV
jgi:hypothetical protein